MEEKRVSGGKKTTYQGTCFENYVALYMKGTEPPLDLYSQKTIDIIGYDNWFLMKDAAKETAEYIWDYLTNNFYNIISIHQIVARGSAGEMESFQLTGKYTKADIVVKTDKGFVGFSLKYSATNKREIKTNGTSFVTFLDMFDRHYSKVFPDEKTPLLRVMTVIGTYWAKKQQQMAFGYVKELETFFTDPLNARYGRMNGLCTVKVVEDGVDLSEPAVDRIRSCDNEELNDLYRGMRANNVSCKHEMSSALRQRIEKFVSIPHTPENQKVQAAFMKEMIGIRDDQLLTIQVYAKRHKQSKELTIEHLDLQRALNNYLEANPIPDYRPKAKTIRIHYGPGTFQIDTRVSTNRPLTYPAYYSVLPSIINNYK